mmetsp:Transcript_70950/g.123018  ORF Transcript_70950/g.123018 Transcript_70950/m.123018 type:complete len:255 (-) Transcript_70950:477-1241(-)
MVVRWLVHLLGDTLIHERLREAAILWSPKNEEQLLTIFRVLCWTLKEAKGARLLLDLPQGRAFVTRQVAQTIPWDRDYSHVFTAFVVHFGMLTNTLLEQPLQILLCTSTLNLAATKVSNSANILHDAARSPSKLLAGIATLAQSIAVVVFRDEHGVRSEPVFLTYVWATIFCEVPMPLFFDGSHDLELCTTACTFWAKDGETFCFLWINIDWRSLGIHHQEEEQGPPLVFHEPQVRTLGASDEAHGVGRHTKNR